MSDPLPQLSEHFKSRFPSSIRMAQIEFANRTDKVSVVNTAIGNVSLPMHPSMQKRMFNLQTEGPFTKGIVKYTDTVGQEECNNAFLNIIASSGLETKGLYSQITDGGSQAMELLTIGLGGTAGTNESPLLLIDAAYTNYVSMAERLGRKTVSVTRTLKDDGRFTLPDINEIEEAIKRERPSALVVIPYDNPTGQFFSIETLAKLAELCVRYNMWMVSDEAYREFVYIDEKVSSIWAITNKEVDGIEGRRISVETSSKVWNACGLRIGALITDNKDFHEKAVFENTGNLCSNSIGQYIFGALAKESHKVLQKWYQTQRNYYQNMMLSFAQEIKKEIPDIIVSRPDASLYSVLDVRKVVKDGFKSLDFVMYCARLGRVDIDGESMTLLTAPMSGFYNIVAGLPNPGKTQMRVAFVESPEKMKLVPKLFSKLLSQFEANRWP